MGKFWNKESKADNYSIQLCPQFCKEPHHLPSLQKDEHSPDKTKMKILETFMKKIGWYKSALETIVTKKL